MKAIVCVDKNWGIGYKGKLLVKNPKDMEFFKEKTIGKNIIMGRKTLESFRCKKPLPKRTNIVLSRSDLNRTDIIQFKNIEDFLSSPFYNDETIVIGGGEIYKQLLTYCDEIFVTKMENEFIVDTYFPNLDNLGYIKTNESEMIVYENIKFKFITYKKED